MNNNSVKTILAMVAFGAALASPASASTITAVVNTGGLATFTNGVLTGFSGLTLTSFAGFADNSADVTITVSGGNVLFTALGTSSNGAFTGALANLNGNGAFLTIAVPTASGLSGTQPSLTLAYGTGSGMLSAAAAADLSVTTALTNSANTFSTNACSSGCSGSTGSTVDGIFNISSNTNAYTATATPEPGSFFLLGAAMLAAAVLYKRKDLVRSFPAR